MNYGYFNCYITDINEDVDGKVAEIQKYVDEVQIETLSYRPALYEILKALQPEDTVYVYSFKRFCSGLRDLSELMEIIVDDCKANLVSIADGFDSTTEAGKAQKIAYKIACDLINADPNHGFFR